MTRLQMLLMGLFLLGPHLPPNRATMHWTITEHGMINSMSNSHFNMRRPWELVEWLRQEERAEIVRQVEDRLTDSDRLVDLAKGTDDGFEENFYATSPVCKAAGKPLSDFDLHTPTILTLEHKDVKSVLHLTRKIEGPEWKNIQPLLQPVCENLQPSLGFSPYTFEHLEAMHKRASLQGIPEVFLYQVAVPSIYNPDQFGHLVALSLQRNTTSWVLLNMAAFYWRVKGVTPRTVECLRRALHHSPYEESDVALVSLANVLHMAKYSEDAATVMHAALAVSPRFPDHYFMMGNMYAVTGQHNLSIEYYSKMLKLLGGSDMSGDTDQRIMAVYCNRDLERSLEEQEKKLSKALIQLQQYQGYAAKYKPAKLKLVNAEADHKAQMQSEYFFDQQIEAEQLHSNCDIDGQSGWRCKRHRHMAQVKITPEYHSVMEEMMAREGDSYQLEREKFQQKAEQLETIQHIRSVDYSQPLRPPLYVREAPPLPADHFLNNASWPPLQECENVPGLPTRGRYPTVYLPAENKGYEVQALLGEAQGIAWDEEHELPWHPPQCMYVNQLEEASRFAYDHIEGMKLRLTLTRPVNLLEKFFDHEAKPHLRRLGREGSAQIEDVGQRIFTAMEQRMGPNWLLFNIAGLYWRAQGHIFFGLECQRRALFTVPPKFRDVPLVNLGVMFYKWGRYEDAKIVVGDALAVNPYEPITHLFYGSLLAGEGNLTGALHHWTLAVRAKPELVNQCSSGGLENRCVRDLIKAARCQLTSHARVCLPGSSMSSSAGCSAAEGSAASAAADWGAGSLKVATVAAEEPTSGLDDKRVVEAVCEIFNTYQLSGREVDCPYPFRGQKLSVPHVKLVLTGPRAAPGPPPGPQAPAPPVTGSSRRVMGVLHGFLWLDQSKMILQDDECLVFNDTSRTIGCHGNDRLFNASEKFVNFMFECLSVIRPNEYGPGRQKRGGVGGQSTHSLQSPLSGPEPDDNPVSGGTAHDEDTLIGQRLFLSWPSLSECERTKPVNFATFTSTYLSVEAKGVDVTSHLLQIPIDKPDQTAFPLCTAPNTSWIETIMRQHKVWDKMDAYNGEVSLINAFDSLAGGKYNMQQLARRLASGLERSPSDWVLANLAGLYWRIKGNMINAIHCFQLGFESAPVESKDVSLIGAANIMHQVGRLAGGLALTRRALELSPNTIISHFTMANLYGAQAQWHRATLFYEATLGLQGTFKFAVERLRAIQCHEVRLSERQKYTVEFPLP